MRQPSRAEQFVQRSLQTGARRVLLLGDVPPLVPHLLELMPDAVFTGISTQPLLSSDRFHLVQADACVLPFKRWVFDLALIYEFLPTAADPPTLLHAALRCLRPGGELAVGHQAHETQSLRVSQIARWTSDFGARVDASVSDGETAFLLCIAP
jgi:SAM-dependent methyltransferase